MQQAIRQVARQRLQNEREMFYKEGGAQRLRFALAYPNTYFIGMSNLGLQTMYRLINQRPDTACERVFLPDPAEMAWYASGQYPLSSLESQRPLSAFHILGFSISYENDYVHMLQMLEMARLPLLAAERDERHPLVMVGGAVTYINPEPLADFVDMMVVGDGEETIQQYLDLASDTLGQPRSEHLRQASTLPGIYVPSLYEAGRPALLPRKITDLAQSPAYSAVLTDNTEFSGALLIEITRGCPFKCRFCTVGYIYPKFRQLPGDLVLRLVEEQQRRDYDAHVPLLRKVGLVSSATGDYRHLDQVARGLVDLGVAIGISSLRMDRMPDVLIDCMVRSGVRSCTVAPEAGSERLRQLIRKDMTEAVILDGVERLLAAGMRDLKLYSMIGLPTETDEDLRELLNLVGKIWERMKYYGRLRGTLGTLTLSVNPFIPKPATPLQWCAMAPQHEIKAKLRTLRHALRRESHVRLFHGSLKHDYLEAVLARGDRALRDFLLATHHHRGDWQRAARTIGFDVEKFVGTPLDEAAPLAWELFENPQQIARLHREHARALALPMVSA